MLLHTLFEEGNYKHWRSAVTIWLAMHPPADEGLQLVRVPAGTIAQGVEEGARDSFWVSLPKDAAAKCPPPQASCVIMYLHGEPAPLPRPCGGSLHVCGSPGCPRIAHTLPVHGHDTTPHHTTPHRTTPHHTTPHHTTPHHTTPHHTTPHHTAPHLTAPHIRAPCTQSRRQLDGG
jgi:hypothetical protein